MPAFVHSARPASSATPRAFPSAIEPAAWVGSLLLLGWLLVARPGLPLDDAYITLHNARVLVEHGGADPVYRGSGALTGATSPVHLALVALAGLVLPWVAATKLVTAAGVLAYAAGLRQLARRHGLAPWGAAALAVTGLLAGYLPYHLLNGLETGLALAAVAWAIVLADHRRLPLLCGTLPFVRPELALLAGPLLARHLWMLRAEPARAAAALGKAAVAAAPWLGWSLAATGAALPGTAAAKMLFFDETGLPVGERLDILVGAFSQSYVAPLALLLVALPRERAGPALLLFVAAWLGAALATLPGGLTHNHFRYLALLAPLVAAAQARLMRPGTGLAGWVAGLSVVWALGTAWAGTGVMTDRGGQVLRAALLRDVAALPRDATVLVHDAGFLAWAAPDRHLYDLVGLKTPASVARYRDAPDRPAALSAVARQSGAAFLVALEPGAVFWGAIPDQLRGAGWRVDPLSRPLPGGYATYRLTPPKGR